LRQNFSGHYKHALLYLACVPLESLSAEDKLRRAHNLAISALLGDSIYNFGELVSISFFLSFFLFFLFFLLFRSSFSFNNNILSL